MDKVSIQYSKVVQKYAPPSPDAHITEEEKAVLDEWERMPGPLPIFDREHFEEWGMDYDSD